MNGRIEDLARFTQLQLESKDMNPRFPVLRELQRGMGPDQALWHSLLYMAYYNIASSQIAFYAIPDPRFDAPENILRLPTGVERRGLRGGATMARHLAWWSQTATTYRTLSGFFDEVLTDDPRESWVKLQRLLRLVYGNGRWAAYNTGECLMKVNDLPVEPTDMGNEFSTGPRQGLALFFDVVKGNRPDAIAVLDAQGQYLQAALRARDVEVGIEDLETALCDFHALTDGRYYVGQDIDEMQAALVNSQPAEPSDLDPIWDARVTSLPQTYLGEVNGWVGVDHRRLSHYSRTGEVLSRIG